MIDLTQEQRKSLQEGEAIRIRDNGQEYVILASDVYERLSEDDFDDGPWTAVEMDLLREESLKMLDNFGKNP